MQMFIKNKKIKGGIMMKRFIRWFLIIFALLITTTSISCGVRERVSYHLEYGEFNNVVSFGDEVDLTGLTIR